MQRPRGRRGLGTPKELGAWDGAGSQLVSLEAGNGVRDKMVQEEAELGLHLAWGVESL